MLDPDLLRLLSLVTSGPRPGPIPDLDLDPDLVQCSKTSSGPPGNPPPPPSVPRGVRGQRSVLLQTDGDTELSVLRHSRDEDPTQNWTRTGPGPGTGPRLDPDWTQTRTHWTQTGPRPGPSVLVNLLQF